MDPQLLKRVIEAILLAAAQPLSLAQLGALFTEEEAVDNEQLLAALQTLSDECAERGVELKEVASGYRYQIREDVHSWVTRLWTERQTKYSRALLETLALIAYRQPITRAEIEQIRGVAVSSSIVKTLEEREWVRVVGYRDVPGRPALFGTSRIFLDYFNLKSLDELPPLAEIRDLDEYDPQLDLAPVVPPSLELPPDDDETPATAIDEPAAPGSADDDTVVAGTGDETSADTAEQQPPAQETDAADADDATAIADTQTDPVSDADAERGDAGSADADRAGHDDDTLADDEPAEVDADGEFADDFSDPDFSPDDGDVDPTDPTTSEDVPEHNA